MRTPDLRESPGAQVLHGILQAEVQTIRRSTVIPVPTTAHHLSVQHVAVGLRLGQAIISRARNLPDGNRSIATHTLPACG